MLKDRLSDILSDNVSGASSLYRRTLALLRDHRSFRTRSRREQAIWRLRRTFPEMAVFAYLQERLAKVVDDSVKASIDLLLAEAEEEADRIGRRLDRLWKRKRRVVTFSQSSLAIRLLLERRDRIAELLISMAAPQNEGLAVGARLAEAGIAVELATDAALPGMVRRGDLVIVGADSVTERYFINKCGTLPLLLAARAVGAVSVVVFERFKRTSARKMRYIPRRHCPKEITPLRYIFARIENLYFEKIPIAYADWLLSGDGAVRGKRP
jgi:translation initiation factor 2B subunit (eIF-2B alpha/beta/delta family)